MDAMQYWFLPEGLQLLLGTQSSNVDEKRGTRVPSGQTLPHGL